MATRSPGATPKSSPCSAAASGAAGIGEGDVSNVTVPSGGCGSGIGLAGASIARLRREDLGQALGRARRLS